MDAYIAQNIHDGMTDMELLNAIAAFPAGYDYSVYASDVTSMIVTGGGDCWASTDAIVTLCNKLGITAWWRNGNRDGGAGSGHRNAMVELNGAYYVLEAGYVDTAPRYYTVTQRSSLFSYYIENGSLEIYQYDGRTTPDVLEIPSEIDGRTVVSVYTCCFQGKSTVKEFILPDTLTNISDYAFRNCTGMTKVYIPASTESIGDYAFSGCSGLQCVIFGGTKAQWEAITVGTDNENLQNAQIWYEADRNAVDLEAFCAEHTFTEKVLRAPTYVTAGLTEYTCSVCGYSYTGETACLVHSGAGWEKIGGKSYYFTSSGELVKNCVKKIGSKIYRFDADGAMQTNCWYTDSSGRKFYFGSDGAKVVSAARQIDGKVYLFNTSGVMQTNCWYTDSSGRKFYFGSDGVKVVNTAKQIDGKVYYFASNGKMQTNYWYTTSSGAKYYFGSDGVKVVNMPKQIDGKVYYFGSTGRMQVNTWYTVSGKKFYFGSDGVKVVNTAKQIGGKVYLFNASGAMQVNTWYTVSGKKFYFGSDGVKVVSSVKKIGSYCYYFASNGALQVSGTVTVNGRTLCCGTDGVLYTDSARTNAYTG